MKAPTDAATISATAPGSASESPPATASDPHITPSAIGDDSDGSESEKEEADKLGSPATDEKGARGGRKKRRRKRVDKNRRGQTKAQNRSKMTKEAAPEETSQDKPQLCRKVQTLSRMKFQRSLGSCSTPSKQRAKICPHATCWDLNQRSCGI